MKYEHIEQAVFCSRPNRFIACVEIDGKEEVCHVKNTGRCRELLIPGATVYVERNSNPNRKTALDLITVDKQGTLINIDAQAPNKAVEEWLRAGNFCSERAQIYPERTLGGSRFDFYIEDGKRRIFMEVKGVTLEEDGVVRFPDAPTQRGVKHITELTALLEAGYETAVMFVIQMDGVKFFTPNRDMHPEFADALKAAAEAGVKILACDCRITRDSMMVKGPVEVRL